ncbi:hypothetical protein RI129_006033 [Pyrocoelia pectoralis]|uniref:Cytochrome P450 n=1 Tax=Pyrocoelia pectoralis TaxID=417401 RepID=A0AAN7VGB0_9COLE
MKFLFYYIFCGFLSAILILLILIAIYCKRINGYWKRKGVYAVNPTLFFGNAKDVILQKKPLGVDIKEFYDNLKKNGQSFGGYYFLMQPTFVVSDLNLIKRIMVTDFEHFTDRPLHIDEDDNRMTGYLPTLKGEKWRALRMKLSSAFTSLKCKMMFETLPETYSDTLSQVIAGEMQSHNAVNIHYVLSKLNMDVIASCAFGFECNTLKNGNSELREYLLNFVHNQSLKGSIMHLLQFVFPDIFKIIKIKTRNDKMFDFFTKLVTDIVKYREENKVLRKDFVNILLNLRKDYKQSVNYCSGKSKEEVKEGLSIQELIAQCFVFLLGGFEAPTSITSFCIYELSRKPKLQQKVREEILKVLKKYNGKVSYDALAEMKFTDQCIYESFRMYPPVMIHARVCTKEYRVPNSTVVINEGTTLFVPTYGLHMDPNHFPAPEVFDPDRFSEYSDGVSDAWIPFGSGPRTCIAYRFGLLQAKYGLVTLLKQYKFSVHPSTKTPITFDCKNFLLFPSSPIMVIAEKI